MTEYDYESYIDNLMLAPKGHELENEDNLKFMKMIDLLASCKAQTMAEALAKLGLRTHPYTSIPHL
ncbi:hypothetical protein CFP56_017539 [Quercus suber]|uniref:Uncharacterized protein n=1 Tax=Quercus suber TaxID=58331 RepID=A0AAW0KKU1_QUESU